MSKQLQLILLTQSINMHDIVFLDFETEAIGPRPDYPPRPVGLAIYDPQGKYPNGYLAFGHTMGNNSTFGEVHEILLDIYKIGRAHV